jgi:hypothetical protein
MSDLANSPVYPTNTENVSNGGACPADPGITLRQHYAGIFVAAMVSSIHDDAGFYRLQKVASSEGLKLSQWISKDALKQADALIAALEPTP